MRFKINDTIKPTASFQGSSDYYRYFKYYFDFYLSPNPDLENLDHATELYVKNAEIETLLESAYSNQSFCQMLVGHTGIGKSTIVKNYFDVMRPNPVFRDDNIIIPYYCIAHIKQKDPSKFFTSNMQTVADRLIERTGQRLDREGFWQFIDNNKPEVIRRHRIGEFKSINEDLDAVAAHDPFAYASFLIKFLLMYDCNRVFNNIILLFDDVEALDSTKRKPYIDFAYHTYSCFKNKDAPYHVKLFISERPHTRRDFHGNDWADQKPDINLWSPPRLANIIQARHNYVVKNLAPEAIKRASWTSSYQFLNLLISRVENKTGDLLLSLDNYNIRRALRTLECCLSQGSWFQTTEIKRSSFEIDGRTISVKISRPIVLRAIGYGPRNIYYETENIPPIVNVMKNGYDPTTDLLGLLMVKWFYKHIDTQDAFKISNQQRIGDFINDVRTIFPLIFPETKDFIADVISHFIAARILGKDTRDVSWDEETMLTLMPKGIALWEELADNSVLLELFRDDIWLEKDRHDVSPTRALPREKRFMECIGICQSIALMEQHFHRSLFNISIKRRYINSFGDNTIAYHLSRGILGSIRREIDPHRPALIDNAYKTLSALISNTEEDLHRVHS